MKLPSSLGRLPGLLMVARGDERGVDVPCFPLVLGRGGTVLLLVDTWRLEPGQKRGSEGQWSFGDQTSCSGQPGHVDIDCRASQAKLNFPVAV